MNVQPDMNKIMAKAGKQKTYSAPYRMTFGRYLVNQKIQISPINARSIVPLATNYGTIMVIFMYCLLLTSFAQWLGGVTRASDTLVP